MCNTEYFLTYTTTTTTVLRGDVTSHDDSGDSLDVSVCHAINMTSPCICQSHDLSVCQPKHDSTWNFVHLSVCLMSVLSIQQSVKFMVKIPMSIAAQN